MQLTTKPVYMIQNSVNAHTYLKKIGVNHYVWVDVFDADPYETEGQASIVSVTLQTPGRVVKVEVSK